MSTDEICLEECEVPFSKMISMVAPHVVFTDNLRENMEIKKIIEQTANRALRLVAREVGGFCRSANVDLQENVCHYYLEPPDCWRINLISHVFVCGCCLGAWRDDCSMPCPGFYRYEHKDDVIYIGEPIGQDMRGGMRVTSRMIPSDKSCGMPERIYDDYREAIEFKLLELMHAQRAQQWYDPVASALNKREFKETINDMRWIEFERERMEGPLLRETDRQWLQSK